LLGRIRVARVGNPCGHGSSANKILTAPAALNPSAGGPSRHTHPPKLGFLDRPCKDAMQHATCTLLISPTTGPIFRFRARTCGRYPYQNCNLYL
jgi:hypothetical protein